MFITMSKGWSTPRSSPALGLTCQPGSCSPLCCATADCSPPWAGSRTRERKPTTSMGSPPPFISAVVSALAQESSSEDQKRKALAGLGFWVGS